MKKLIYLITPLLLVFSFTLDVSANSVSNLPLNMDFGYFSCTNPPSGCSIVISDTTLQQGSTAFSNGLLGYSVNSMYSAQSFYISNTTNVTGTANFVVRTPNLWTSSFGWTNFWFAQLGNSLGIPQNITSGCNSVTADASVLPVNVHWSNDQFQSLGQSSEFSNVRYRRNCISNEIAEHTFSFNYNTTFSNPYTGTVLFEFRIGWRNPNPSTYNMFARNITNVTPTHIENTNVWANFFTGDNSGEIIIEQNKEIINNLNNINDEIRETNDLLREQEQGNQDRWESDKQEEQQREQDLEDKGDEVSGLFDFSVLNPFSFIFDLFAASSTNCVSVPIISSWLYNPHQSTWCFTYPLNIRAVLTPVFSILGSMLLFGYVIGWLRSGDRSGITVKGGFK